MENVTIPKVEYERLLGQVRLLKEIEKIEEVIKNEPEAKIKDKDILEPRAIENSYVSYVVVDIKDSEIVIESKDNFILPNLAVGVAK